MEIINKSHHGAAARQAHCECAGPRGIFPVELQGIPFVATRLPKPLITSIKKWSARNKLSRSLAIFDAKDGAVAGPIFGLEVAEGMAPRAFCRCGLAVT